MGEVLKIVSGDGISCSTHFDAQDLFKTIKAWFKRHTYTYVEVQNDEFVHGDKKTIVYDIKPSKKLSDYVKLEIEMRIILDNLKDVSLEKGGHKITVCHGDVSIGIDAFVTNDYEGQWNGRPLYYFFRVVADKFIFAGRDKESTKKIKSDVESLKREIKAYFNMKKMG